MKILKSINNLSWQKLTTITVLIAIALVIPVSVWYVQQETRVGSKAFFPKPDPIVPGKKYGFPSEGDPQITLVWPFLGKVGDSVLIYGNNLGNNPLDKSLSLGSQKVIEQDILRWTPELIEFVIPQNSTIGQVSLTVAGKTSSWPFPFTIYNLETKTQVTESNNVIKVLNPPAGGSAKIKIFFDDGEVMESNEFKGIDLPVDKEIISVEIIDNLKQAFPFFVEPDEFGF